MGFAYELEHSQKQYWWFANPCEAIESLKIKNTMFLWMKSQSTIYCTLIKEPYLSNIVSSPTRFIIQIIIV